MNPLSFAVMAGIGILVLLLFPVFVENDTYWNSGQRKIFFCFYLFWFFPIAGGYITLTGQGIILHLGKKKASYQSYSELLKSDKPSIGDMVKFLEWKSTVEWNGTADEKIFPILAAANLLSCVIYPTVKGSKAFPEMKNALLIRHTVEENSLAVTLKTTVVFNLLSVLVATVKKRIEEMKKNGGKRKKKNA